MAQIVSKSLRVDAGRLREFTALCLEKAGLRADDAELVARSLVESNLRGIDSHGLARLAHYVSRIRLGSIKPQPDIQVHRHAASLARVDGDHGMGQLAMQRATEEALVLARESGAGWVAVENSTHCGALAFYGLQIARKGMLGFVFTHSDSMVVPYAARHAFCGTNPLCFAAPGEDGKDLCLDMATSIVPWNTISNAVIEEVPIPKEWAVDAAGEPTIDPRAVRGVRPTGGYKGSGLGLMIDVFCSFLLGSPYGPHIPAMYGDLSAKRFLGGLVGALDIGRFREVAAFGASIAAMMKEWNGQARAEPDVPILWPGQAELTERQERLEKGVPLGVHAVELLQRTGKELGVEWPG